MTSLKVAVRVRPLSERESILGSDVVVDVQGKDILVTDVKVPENHCYDHRVRVHRFKFDFGFWSVDPGAKKYASQEMVYEEFGRVVLNTVLQGYNSCVIAYGPSGSGKTYTIMGSKEENGLTPRICEGLFTKLTNNGENHMPFQIDISFMEIYNEQVYDLLQRRDSLNCRKPKLRVREHPIHGPFVEGLSTHIVKNIDDVCDLLARGNECRVKAATHIHDRSSRSHAIFTIRCSQACINKSEPREVVSKLHLVDLAGSEKAAPDFCQSRVKEGGNINKSLVTLGNVISVLVELSLRSQHGETNHKQTYVPYRDSHLTWLLKDSLGGNSHTFMLAAISPSKECYIETVSTLRYAQRAQFVLNKPVVNEDPGTEMIRNLQTEVQRLRNLLITAEKLNKKFIIEPLPDIFQLRKIMEESSRKVDIMTKHWFEKWMKTYDVVLNKVAKQNGIAATYFDDSNEYKLPERITEKNGNINKLDATDFVVLSNEVPVISVNQECFVESSECLILQRDTVGFSKKKCETDGNQNHFLNKYEDDICIKKNSSNAGIFNNSTRQNVSLVKKHISNSDNILHKQNIIPPFFKCLSLGGINATYPYCNYSWVTQKQTHVEECKNEKLKTTENSEYINQVTFNTDRVENNDVINNNICRENTVKVSDVQNLHLVCSVPEEEQKLDDSVENIASDDSDTDTPEMFDVYDSLECIPKSICKNENESDSVNDNICISQETLNNSQELTGVNISNTEEIKENKDEEINLEYSKIKITENGVTDFKACNKIMERETSETNLKCDDIKFNDKVVEESKNFLDLLTSFNTDGRDHLNSVNYSKRKDSEIMSLLSFSSLDCPVWKSLDDFLASSEDTSSIPEEEQPDITRLSTPSVRNNISHEILPSNFTTQQQDFGGNRFATELTKKVEIDKNVVERNDYTIFRSMKFDEFARKANNLRRLASNSENKEPVHILEKNAVNTLNGIHNHDVINRISKPFCIHQLHESNNKNYQTPESCNDQISDIHNTFESNVNFLKETKIFADNAKIDCGSSEKYNENVSNKNYIQINDKYISESKNDNVTCNSTSEIYSPKSSALKLTKENLDLLAEKLNERPEVDIDCFNACAAFALDVNNAISVVKLEDKFTDEGQDNQNSISDKKSSDKNLNSFDTIETAVRDQKFSSVNESEKINCELQTHSEKSQILSERNEDDSSCYWPSNMFSRTEAFQNSNNKCSEAINRQTEISKIWQRRNYFENTNVTGNFNFFENHSSLKTEDAKSNFSFSKPFNSTEASNISGPVNEEKDESTNNTVASDSLDNFEQEMIDWAKKYLTRNTSDASSLYAFEKAANSQSIDAQELGLDEFEFTAKLQNESSENFGEKISPEDEIQVKNLKNSLPLQNVPTLASSRSSSSDSITYVFLGKDDNNQNFNLFSDAPRYSSLPGSVSLDSLEKNAFRTKPPCISPRTLSIDSLVAEELLSQLQNSELPPSFKVENITQAQDMYTPNLSSTQNTFGDTLYNSIRQKIGKMYETNITEVLSPESNCSFNTSGSIKDTLREDNKTTFNSEVILEKSFAETNQNTCQQLNDRLQRIPLGTSECFVNDVKYTKSSVKKSATNSEIYKIIGENKIVSPENSLRISSPYNSVNSRPKKVQSAENGTLTSQTLSFSNTNFPSSCSEKEIIMESIVVPPPTSFSTDENVQFHQNINKYNKWTQTNEIPLPISKPNEHDDMSANTADIILRMMEMMTETIKFLKSENYHAPFCHKTCSYRIPKGKHERRKIWCDEFEKSSNCTSPSSNASTNYSEDIKSSYERCDKHYACKTSIANKTKKRTSNCCRHKKKQKQVFLNATALPCQHHQISPENCQNEELISKCNTNCEDGNAYPSCIPSNDYCCSTPSPKQHRCESEGYETNLYSKVKSPKISEPLQSNRRCTNEMIKAYKDVHSSSKISYSRQKHPCCDNCKKGRHRQTLGSHSTPTNSSSSEGYLSSISSITQHKHSDDTDSALIEEHFKGTSSKLLVSKAKKLKPLILNKRDGATTPNASWQNTSADSGAFFLDSPLAENKNFSTANRSPDASNSFLLQPIAREIPLACEKEINAPCRKVLANKSKDASQHRLHSHQDTLYDFPDIAQMSINKNSLDTQTIARNVNLREFSEMPSYYLKEVGDMEEEDDKYLDISVKPSCKPFTKSTNPRPILNRDRERSKQSFSNEEFSKKPSDENYNVTRADIERILESIERDKQFLRRRRNLIFESRYSPEIRISSPTEDEDLSDSYKSLPKPVLYVNVPKDRPLIT